MKTLIINGSPRTTGDTTFLLSELKKGLDHEFAELSAYHGAIKPCNDCRACTKKHGCVIEDDMRLIYADDFDNVVIASPVHMTNLSAPLIGLASRFQVYYCAKRFLKEEVRLREKRAALILVGGGGGGPSAAIYSAQLMFKQLNAKAFEKHVVFSLDTDNIPAWEDQEAIQRVREMAQYLNRNK